MRIGAIDIGTNTVLLLVAEMRGAELVAVEERATITRLGEGVDKSRELMPEAIARTSAALDAYAEITKRLGVEKMAVVGTSAMRDARGGEKIRAQIKTKFGIDARVLSGDEEARMTFAGALSGLSARPGFPSVSISESEDVAVFDIGGGSTEIVRGKNGVIGYAHSFDIGSVRFTERYVKSDPPTPEEIETLKRAAADEFARAASIRASRVVGIAGTVTTLAAVALKMADYDGARVHGHVMTREVIAKTVDRLASMPLENRQNVIGLEPKRADVIVAGGIIALAAMDALVADEIMISDRGVRWGLALELASS
jgi:exopolyphosphatase/guanosine-5'-triphosphate,3'-diphosphate pyrophosphatase